MAVSSRVSILVLTFGAYPELAKRSIGSVLEHCDRSDFELVVGANAVGAETEAYLKELKTSGWIDVLLESEENINQCPMMRRMLKRATREFVWWLDDDSYIIDSGALRRRLDLADSGDPTVVQWGRVAVCSHKETFTRRKDPVAFVRSATWYRGLPPPSWKVGGLGEFDYEGKGTGNGMWRFVLGGEWFMRRSALEAIGWPDPRIIKDGADVFLGEAIRQQGWSFAGVDVDDVVVDDAERRGSLGLGREP